VVQAVPGYEPRQALSAVRSANTAERAPDTYTQCGGLGCGHVPGQAIRIRAYVHVGICPVCPKYTTSLIRPAIQNHLHPPFSLSSLTPISDAIHGGGERLRPAARCRSLPPERSLASTGRGARRPYPRRRSSTRRLVFPVPVPMGTTEVVNPSAA
jgi:hypothetical protein